MAGKLGLDKYKRVAETQDETSVNQATRETMKLVQKSMDDKLNEFSLYKIIIKYPHTLSSIIHFIKFLLFMFSFGFSFLLYSMLLFL